MNTYNPNVLIGNWYYDLMLQEEKIKQYMRRSKNQNLKVQRARQLFLSMLKEIPLTFPVVGLSYGAVIQIVAPEMPFEKCFKLEARQGMALGADIEFTNIHLRTTFFQNDPVIGTGLLTPCARNVWTLVPHDPTLQGKELRFGDSFYIKLYESNPPLYVEAAAYKPTVPRGESGHILPKLVTWMGTLTRFKVVHANPRIRYETEGQVVPPFEKVAIIQGASTESLALESDTWFPTYFGMECEVSVHTFKDPRQPHKPDPRNFWSFILSSA